MAPTDDEQNPFVAFKHFADTHLSTALTTLTTLPTTLTTLRARLEEAESDAHKAWQRFNDSYERATNPERRQTERQEDMIPVVGAREPHQERRRDEAVWAGWTGEAWPGMSGQFGYDGADPRKGGLWRPSLHFFFHDRYSPLRLERQAVTDEEGSKWRRAFEELLELERGDMTPRKSASVAVESAETAADWLGRLAGQGMIRQGLLGAMLPQLDEIFPPPDEFFARWAMPTPQSPRRIEGGLPREERSPETEDHRRDEDNELDLYTHFLGSHSPHPGPTEEPSPSGPIPKTTASPITPSIIATLTTTETYTLPDGTVTTKTLLKKRFTDGSELSEESTETKHGSIPAGPKEKEPIRDAHRWAEVARAEEVVHDAVKGSGEVAAEGGGVKGSSRGNWFWSGW